MAEYRVTIKSGCFTKTLVFMGETFQLTYSREAEKIFKSDSLPLPAQVQMRFPSIPPYITYTLIHDLSVKKLSASDQMKILRALTEYEAEQNH